MDEQARFRTVVNRSYYGPLLTLKSRIESTRGAGVFPGKETHSKIRRILRDSRVGHLLKIEKELGALAELREEADYELARPDYNRQDVEEVLQRGRKLLGEIGAAPQARLDSLRL